MTLAKENNWTDVCLAQRVSPEEVELVWARYDAHRRFARKNPDSLIALEQWFRFYHMEKASEAQEEGPSPSGCSVDSDAVNNACIKRPSAFLVALQAYAKAVGQANDRR